MRGRRRIVAVSATLLLATSVTGCGSSGGDGSGGAKPVGAFSTLTGKTTTVILASGFVKALTKLGLKPSPIGTAKFEKLGSHVAAVFPITGGNATIYRKGKVTPYVQGEIVHLGSGLMLKAGKKTVKIANFVIDPGNHSSLTGDVTIDGGTPLHGIKLFDLDGTTLKTPTISKKGVATLSGTKIYLSAEAAAALNGVFKTNALAGNHKIGVGVAVIKATGK